MVRVSDKGSKPRYAQVDIPGVPAYGVINSGSNVTIMGELLWKVAAVAKLHKKDLKPPDRYPRNYDQRPFKLHGRVDLKISFAGREMITPVYIKMDNDEPLLLSEGVCHQRGIVQYHPQVAVRPLKERQRVAPTKETSTGSEEVQPVPALPEQSVNSKPTTTLKLVQSLRLPPGLCAVVPVLVIGVVVTGTAYYMYMHLRCRHHERQDDRQLHQFKASKASASCHEETRGGEYNNGWWRRGS